jgi:hypothetical protein
MNKEKRFGDNISKTLAKKMIAAYDVRRKSHENQICKEDSKSIYIDKMELLDFLETNKNAKGIRLYFAIVGDYGISQNQYHLKKYKDQTTIILMPTESESKLINDANPFIFGSFKEGEAFDENEICPPASDGSNKCIEIL